MKALMNFLAEFFTGSEKNSYIGLSGIKNANNPIQNIKKETKDVEKTALTGLLKRASW